MKNLLNSTKFVVFALAGTLACLSGADAQGLQLDARSNVLGNANQFGYARIVKDLGSLPLNEERTLPINLIFSSDPSVEPGFLGPGWLLPLFDSTAYRSRRGVLLWESPDEYRRFFVADSSAEVGRDETGYISQKTDWRVVENERRGSIRIHSMKDPEQIFEYRDGQLYEFCYGADTATFAVEYDGRGHLKRVFDRSTQRTVMEVRYSGSETQAIVIGDVVTGVVMGDGDWTAPDGKVDYRNYRVSFLRRLGSEEDGESFTYIKDKVRHRAVAPGQSLAVNRLVVEQGGRKSWLSYEAQSGFLVADSGGEYSVTNPAYDPFGEQEKGQPRVSPRMVRVERQLNAGGAKELWSRDWPKGLETLTEPDGKLTRRTWIMAKGPAYGKLRRVEEQVDGVWEMIKTMTYRPDGKLLREIDRVMSVTTYTYDDSSGELYQIAVNGEIAYFRENLEQGFGMEIRRIRANLIQEIFFNEQTEIVREISGNRVINKTIKIKNNYEL